MPLTDPYTITALIVATLPAAILLGLFIEIVRYLRHRRYDRERIARIIKRYS